MDNRGYSTWASRWRVPLGFAAGAAYLILCQPTQRALAVGGTIAFVGLAVRALSAGHLDKNQYLAMGGPYAYTRNPLYLGSALMGVGFAVAGDSWWIALVFALLFLLVYWPVIRREEDFLQQKFGETYDLYARRTPLFFPWRPKTQALRTSFRWERYRRNHEHEAAFGFAAVVIFLLLKMMLR